MANIFHCYYFVAIRGDLSSEHISIAHESDLCTDVCMQLEVKYLR